MNQSPRLKLISYIALLASILFGTTGQLLMKQTMSHPTEGFSWWFLQQLALALTIYSLGVANWILALKMVNLSIAYPLSSLNYVGILVGSYYWFGETITPTRIVGVGLIFVGVLFVVLPIKKNRQLQKNSS